MPAAAGTAASDETPGTTSNRTPASASASLLAAASEDEEVAALQAHDLEPCATVGDEELVDRLLGERLPPDPQRVGQRLLDELVRDEAVVDEDVAAADELEAGR